MPAGIIAGVLRRWIFGDQLGPHFLDGPGQQVLLVEAKDVFRRRVFHRQRAHLVLSAIRHRAAELGGSARLIRADTYTAALRQVSEPLEVCQPTSRAAVRLVQRHGQVTVLPARGFVTSRKDFEIWADTGHARLRLEDYYRYARKRHHVLVGDDGEPAGGAWMLEPAQISAREPDRPRPPAPPAIVEDDIDAQVRRDLDEWEREGIRFVGRDAPRAFPATRAEAVARLEHFVAHRLVAFGPLQELMTSDDRALAHSKLSTSFNLGLLHPLEAVRLAERAYLAGSVPLASAEAFCRQLLGWRDYIWHLYWYFKTDYPETATPGRLSSLPAWFTDLDVDQVRARCVAQALREVRDHAWTHQLPRLLVLQNYGLQRGWRSDDLTDWFQRVFIDGHMWAMVGNIIGLSQYADLGLLVNKPYVAQGGQIDRMSDFCGGCRYRPRVRLGAEACPLTAGYWSYLARVGDQLHGNTGLRHAVRGLDRISDIAQVIEQERKRGTSPP
jgi:deoxyribodipyrimidine photolyase-related protein